MAYLGMLRLLQILQNSPCGNDSSMQMINTEAFQVLHIKVSQQLLLGSLICEYPVIKLEGEVFGAKEAFKVLFASPVEEDLLGREITQELLHIVCRSLASEELTCGDIKEGDTKRCLAEVDGSEEVVFLVIENVV